MSKLKNALKNEYAKSLILLVIVVVGILAFWIGLRAYLRTDYPLLAVASGSMVPTLKVGDLIAVQGGLNVSDIMAAYETGDIVVFHKPENPDELIVHRAVSKLQDGNGLYLVTKGDANPGNDYWKIYDHHLVGKVVSVAPYIGNLPLFIRTPGGMTIIVILIVIMILIEVIIPFAREKKKQESPKEEIDVLDIGSL